MRKQILLALLLLSGFQTIAQYPKARLTNGLIDAEIYLPDSNNGFYRGTRFDWAGVIASLKFKEHEYFGQWYPKHDPKWHDAISGPVEAFDPIAYSEAEPGGTFLKIGIGTLRKSNTDVYRFSAPFEIINPGSRKVRIKKDRIQFIHKLQDETGYAYIYKKTLRLVKGKAELILEHSLRNTGHKPIITSVFNHNFFVMDNQTTGTDFSVTLPFKIETKPAGKQLISFQNNQLIYLRDLKRGESTMEYPKGFTGDKVEDYDFRIENSKTRAGVRITSDRPLSNFMYWSVPTTLSPEPFIKIDAQPGKKFKWAIKYLFYTIEEKTN